MHIFLHLIYPMFVPVSYITEKQTETSSCVGSEKCGGGDDDGGNIFLSFKPYCFYCNFAAFSLSMAIHIFPPHFSLRISLVFYVSPRTDR